MKTYNNLYKKLCSSENLELAYKKARRRKSDKLYVIEFEKNLQENLLKLKHELENLTYKPRKLKKFIIRDPKTRKIHASVFRDRVVYQALCNIIEPIFDKTFIYDSYANRKYKGVHKAIKRFDEFKRKVSNNGKLVNNNFTNNNVEGYYFKADIKHYFETVNHKILIKILRRKIKDEKIIWLIKTILDNFDTESKGVGMPLGNLTSQFFANVYLNELDYFIKHNLKVKYYIRYVDDFVILHEEKQILIDYKNKINEFLKSLELELHTNKSSIKPLRNGSTFLGYRNFYHYKLLRKSNIKNFEKDFKEKLDCCKEGLLTYSELTKSLQGWFGYAMWANTYNYRKKAIDKTVKAKSK